MDKFLIKISNVDFTYSGVKRKSLNDINLSIPENSFTVVIGPSGCGKSTLLKIVSEIERPQKGIVTVLGNSSFVFQSGALLPWRTVLQNVYIGIENLNISVEEKHKRVRNALKLMNIYELENEYPRNISGGQKQRVGIARALATNPDILFLDEPFSALDPETAWILHSELLDIWKKNKMTILMVSHSMEEAVLLADNVVIMENGEIKREIAINLGRPRTTEDMAFRQITTNLRLALDKSGGTIK